MIEIVLLICVFGFIATLVYFGATLVLGQDDNKAEDRLDDILNNRRSSSIEADESDFLRSGFDDGKNALDQFLSGFPSFAMFVEQSGLNMTVSTFVFATGAAFAAGTALHFFLAPFRFLCPLTGLVFGALPFAYVYYCRGKRLEKYSAYLPDALSMMANAMRAGQSLPAGFRLVAEQTPAPLGPEFARCYEEQNLGIPLDEALEEMTVRAPNVDLKFFATAVILQRQTGGDLSEILDKIARLIRERYQIQGMIKALTGEGRLSGVVLLSLPPALMLVMVFLNSEYISKLFTHPMGQQMLAGAIVLQFVGFLWIKKIIDIRV